MSRRHDPRSGQRHQTVSLPPAAVLIAEVQFIEDFARAQRFLPNYISQAEQMAHTIQGPRLLTPASVHLTHCIFPGPDSICQRAGCPVLRDLPHDSHYDHKSRVTFAPSHSLGAMQGLGVPLGGVLAVGSQCIDNPFEHPPLSQPRGSIKYFLKMDGNDEIPPDVERQLHIPGNCEHKPVTRFDIAAWIGVAVAARLGVQDVRYLRANLVKFEYAGRGMWRAVVNTTA
ncbi:hypothetical protein FB45DRAFT_870371 [Roridomyces roridus]|uniref:Uncharacterized protein n=1 Tax=Roridomyces roridus TaxID=1738132 RepID=A0AAD7BIE6_9AGAR|nr:hypothetical protein FB45DRAFT_870371 [Roridomyces roridus]